MPDTLRCPGCAAELTIPASVDRQVQCPRCLHVFDLASRSSSALTALPLPHSALPIETDDHDLFQPTPRLAKGYSPSGRWAAVLLSIALIGNVIVFSLWALIFLDRVFRQLGQNGWILGFPKHQVEEAAGIAPLCAFVAFIIWAVVALRNARFLNSAGLLPESTMIVAFLCVLPGIVIGYIHLQQLWKSSDPQFIEGPESWRKVSASWWIRAWAMFCLGVPMFLFVGSVFDNRRMPNATFSMGVLANLSWVFACLLLIAIIHMIGRRQFQRYIRLYEDPA